MVMVAVGCADATSGSARNKKASPLASTIGNRIRPVTADIDL
jgi:hypothetical protein